jgi:cytochrome c oxidase subunit 2
MPAAAITAATLALGACSGDSALNPGGVNAARIHGQWWFFVTITTSVYVLVMLVLLIALARRRAATDDKPEIKPDPSRERRMKHVIIGALTVTTLILFAFLIADFLTGRALSAVPENAMRIKVVGHQWWWEIQYISIPWEPNGGQPHGIFTTANEIHVPVGQPVYIELEARDVIHSFWVPRLNGKKDLIPGQNASTWIEADEPGTFRGRCAEYCGEQHANMQIWVVAEPRDKFDQWLQNARRSAPEPATERQSRGRQVFLSNSCILCHTVDGTMAHGALGPNLTHVASRQAIAAGALATTRDNLERWVTNPQRIKPGVRMPQNIIPPDDLQALLDWLQTLK